MERRVKSKLVRGTESINLWTLWMEVLCAMMLSSAGGPSLAQPCKWRLRGEWQKIAFRTSHLYRCVYNSFFMFIFFFPRWKQNKREAIIIIVIMLCVFVSNTDAKLQEARVSNNKLVEVNRLKTRKTEKKHWIVAFLTRCNASTCRSWKSEVKSLMAWLARITDKTPNPWCLKKNANKIQLMYISLQFITFTY